MKKTIILITLIIPMIILSLFGCTKDNEKIKILVPVGTPLMAVGNLLDDDDFEFNIVNGQDSLIASFSESDYNIIIAPLNLGAKLYLSNNSSYKLEAILTTNNTYLISKTELTLNDLKNKTVMAYGNGSTPALALNAVIQINKLDTTVVYKNSASDVAELFLGGTTEGDYFLSAEPNITSMIEKKHLEIHKIDISDELNDLDYLIQACLFINPNKKISEKVLNKINDNIKYMNEKPSEYANSVITKNEYFSNLGNIVIEKAIPNSNIIYLKAKDNKTIVEKYYSFLNTYNSKILGSKTPDENFYN